MQFMLIGVMVYTSFYTGGLSSMVDDHGRYMTLAACEKDLEAISKTDTPYTYHCFKSVEEQKQ